MVEVALYVYNSRCYYNVAVVTYFLSMTLPMLTTQPPNHPTSLKKSTYMSKSEGRIVSVAPLDGVIDSVH